MSICLQVTREEAGMFFDPNSRRTYRITARIPRLMEKSNQGAPNNELLNLSPDCS